ncbi:putative metallophosphoesterase [Raphanus sativus]|uniref:Metallophosphoesterase At3g03305 n=1 Tax=Raphanus sativus TaxID=3726 RepID=A0A9W3CPH4_RAPSA|nr:putative metallophosphoesterase At3g03305 [Raphanus sativus]KAJ4871358.1 putative metallophosphoesterase [Raphanus sativus]
MEANGDDDEQPRKNTPLQRSSILLILLLLLISLCTTSVSGSVDESGGRRRVIEARSGQDLVWVVQLSDLHFSVHHPERAIDFRDTVAPALSLINPSLVLITGDLTDGKSEDLLTMKQNEQEWLEYSSVMRDVVKRSGLNKTIFYDLRGNHDNFGVPSLASSVDFFSKYSINAQLGRKENINTITLETSERKHLFVGVDTTMDIGLRGPTNLFGHPTDELLTSLDSHLSQWDDEDEKKPAKPVTKISFGHFPLSFSALSRSKKSLRDVFLKHSVSAYLCGHLHSRFGKNLKRLHSGGGVGFSDNDLFQLNMRRSSGGEESDTNCSFGASPAAEFWEWEMGDWRKNRAVRIVAIDRGHVSYLDIDLKSNDAHKTIILPTFPLDSRFMSTSLARHRYECQHMISSSYDAIRAIVFSRSIVVDVVARVYDWSPGFDNLVMEAPMRKHGDDSSSGGASFYSLPWNYRAFEDPLPDRFWLQIEVTDIKGRSTLSEMRPFSINGLSSEVSWTWNEFRVMGCQWAALYFPILWSVLCCLLMALLVPKCIIVVFKKQYTLKKFVAKKGLVTFVLWILQDLCRLPVVWFGYVAYLFYLVFFPWFSGEVFTDSGKRTYMTIMGWVVTSSDRKHEYVGEPDVMVLVIPHLVFVVIPSLLIVCCLVAERELYKEHVRAVSGKKEDDHDRGRKKRWQRRSVLFSKRRLVRKTLLLASLALYWKHFKNCWSLARAYEMNVVHFPGYSLVVPLLLLYVICKTHRAP